jgi:ABC-type antimicrobial peptide transport system permease subunit
MMMLPNASTIIIKSADLETKSIPGLIFKDTKELTKQTIAIVEAKSGGMSIFYGIFMLLAMIAIFDTQTLSIFRRQREIGTFVALGMTQRQVVSLFTLEGTMNAVLAIIIGAIWGTPLFIYLAKNGITLPMDTSSMGIAIADVMYPLVTLKLVLSTIIFILVITAFVSYLPARKIAKMNPTDAIRGKVN